MADEGCENLPQIPEDVLQDLCSRFLINIPEDEKNDVVRICFQIELAHWYYIDFCRQDDPDLPGCGMKAFISIIFSQFTFLNKTRQPIQFIYEKWRHYKVRVPVFGAILLDESLEKCLLVQGFHNKTSWGFPKGKVNKDEDDLHCAIREVWEEVGYDISPLAKPDQFLENTIHDHQLRLYIVPGVDQYYLFKPNTRGEIKEIRWFNIHHLPTHKKDTTPKEQIGLMASNFFMIHTFIKPLRKWIADKKDRMSSFLPSTPVHKSTKDKNLDEKKEFFKKQRDKDAEEFKQMHMLMNPLRSSKQNEETLKSLLGMNVNIETCTNQPEAIRKLLSGTVEMSPRTTPEKPKVKQFNSKANTSSSSSTSLFSSGSSRPYAQDTFDGRDFVGSIVGKGMRDQDQSRKKNIAGLSSGGLYSRSPRATNLRDKKQASKVGKERDLYCHDADVPFKSYIHRENSPKTHTHRANSPKTYTHRANSPKTYMHRTNSPLDSYSKKLKYPEDKKTKQRTNVQRKRLSDFEYSSPSFAKFQFDYQKILSVLT